MSNLVDLHGRPLSPARVTAWRPAPPSSPGEPWLSPSLRRPVPLDAIDVSTLMDYLRCMRYGLFKHLLGWVGERSAQDAYFGQCVHKALELLWQTSDPGHANATFHGAYRRRYGPETDADFSPKMPSVFDRAWQLYLERIWPRVSGEQVMWSEQTFDLWTQTSGLVGNFAPGMHLITKPDTIAWSSRDNLVRLHEIKSSKYVESSWWALQWQNSGQIAAYLEVVRRTLPTAVDTEVAIDAWKFSKPPRLRQDGQPYAGDVDKDCQVYELGVRMRPLHQQQLLRQLFDKLSDVLHQTRALLDGTPELRARLFPRACTGEACCRYMQPCPYADHCAIWDSPFDSAAGGHSSPPEGLEQRWWDPRVGEVFDPRDSFDDDGEQWVTESDDGTLVPYDPTVTALWLETGETPPPLPPRMRKEVNNECPT